MKLNRSAVIRNGVITLIFMATLLLLAATPSVFAQSDSTQASPTPENSVYVVRPGDGWGIIAQRFGTTIIELKRLNPQSVRFGDILHVGEQLQVPFQTPVAIATEYVVQPGDGWGIIAQRYGVTIQNLMDANPQHIRSGMILRTGDRLVIPAVGGAIAIATENANSSTNGESAQLASEGTAEPESTATAANTPTTLPTNTPVPTDTEAPTDTPPPADTETSSPTQVAEPEATEVPAEESVPATNVSAGDVVTDTTSTEAGAPEIDSGTAVSETAPLQAAGCPVNFSDYVDVIVAKANDGDDASALQSYLTDCGTLRPESLVSQDWTGDQVPDLALVYDNPAPVGVVTETEMLILNSSPTGYQLGFQARPAGAAQLLATFDINEDGKPDIVWSDTNCGASTCFVTVNVQSWDGTAWQNWTAENMTLPEATVTLEDRMPDAQGLEILLNGGLYGSVGAGPQRGRVETWGSVNGEPYTQLDVLYNASPCLYHAVLDANEAYAKGSEDNYRLAQELYDKAYSDTNLKPCWTRTDEEDDLRSFSLFRLALVAAQTKRTDDASFLIDSLNTLYPNSPVTPAANVWLSTLTETGNVEGACAKANEYAVQNPQVVDILADYGYANPTFSARDFCPVPVVAESEPAAESSTETVASSAATTATVASPISETAATTETTTVTETATVTESATSEEADAVSAALQAASCPTDLKGFSEALPNVLAIANGDKQTILDYLKICKAADDNSGNVVSDDLNGDGTDDVAVLPSIRSDLGFGPNGTQGAVLVYHGLEDGSYTLAYNPEIYGGTKLLADEDLNGDGKIDLAWTVTGCTTSCLTETQIVSWSEANNTYASIIRPGALIAEGKVELAPVPPADPGKGRQLVMSGGVSTLPDSGLPVPHTEIWESVDGAPFQRISWTYDRKAENSDCFGLRLVEAQMALEAEGVLSYQPAINLYQDALDDESLKTCSIHDLDPEVERSLLQGLGGFRLVQALALRGDSEGAEVALATLEKSNASEDYKQIAATWLETYQTGGQPDAACAAVQPMIDAKAEIWQITDHYGFNHSVAGQQKICFVPEAGS